MANLKKNLSLAKDRGGESAMAVVKADAYGHGLEEVSRLMVEQGVSFLGVANVGEARRIAAIGIETPVYLLGATWEEEREEIVEQGWVSCISTLDEVKHLNQLGRDRRKAVHVHIALDTGMGRGGFLPKDLGNLMEWLRGMDHLVVDGIGSHLPAADEDEAFTHQQIAQFERVVTEVGGLERLKWRHLLNSAGVLAYEARTCNLIRPGLMLYGVAPVEMTTGRLLPVMSLKSRVTLVRELPAGHGVSYGRTFVTQRPSLVATVGIGYGDGYPRSISGQGGEVWVRNQRLPILGRITMDQIMIDVTDCPQVKAGDEVEVFGEHIPVSEVADKAGMIPWEVFTGIAPRVERRYL